MARFASREAYFDYLDDYAGQRRTEINKEHLSQGLITSYLLEMHYDDSDAENEAKIAIGDWTLERVGEEESFFTIYNPEKTVGYAEIISPRFMLVHSTLPTAEADNLVKHKIKGSLRLDSAWLSGLYLQEFWRKIVHKAQPHRVVKIKFEHQSSFQATEFGEEYELFRDGDYDDDEVSEQPSSVSEIKEQSFQIARILPKLQDIYPPFKAIKMIRIPALASPGGYDLWSWGKMTYRAHSFRHGRSMLTTVTSLYNQLTEFIEDNLLFSIERTNLSIRGEGYSLQGSPLILKFNPELLESTFLKLVETTFVKGQGPLRLWGNPIWMGGSKVHVYGIDLHLWQKIYVEVTRTHMTVVLPKGTCGNTVHRLVTNIQRFVSPGVEAFLGNVSYQELIDTVFGD